jgi:Family of unknown function (DUF5825)
MACSDLALLTFVASLRDHTARGEQVAWRLDAIGDLDPDLLCHLVPPSGPCSPGMLARWHKAYRFGLLYFRRGPGFVVVYDGRPISAADEILLDEPEEVQLFERLREPAPLGRSHPAAQRLRAAKLLLETSGLAVALPYRESRIALPLDLFSMGSAIPAHISGPPASGPSRTVNRTNRRRSGGHGLEHA